MGSAGNDIIEDDDEDIAVASERISIKCPITLLPMKDPVTSQKCPHSFEKEAILGMIDASDVRVGGSGRRGDGQKAMRCPVCEVVCQALVLFYHVTLLNFSTPSSLPQTTSKRIQSLFVRSNVYRLPPLVTTKISRRMKMMIDKPGHRCSVEAVDQRKSLAPQ